MSATTASAAPPPNPRRCPAVRSRCSPSETALGTFMEVLDTSIANVAVPTISGSPASRRAKAPGDLVVLGGVRDRGAAHRLARAAGRRVRLFTLSVLAFTIASALCGLATNRDADRVPAAAGPRVGADGAAVADDPDAQLPAREARNRARAMGDDGDRRPDLRPVAGRLDQRQLRGRGSSTSTCRSASSRRPARISCCAAARRRRRSSGSTRSAWHCS